MSAAPADLVVAARASGVSYERALAAVAATPRAAFAPPGYAGASCSDQPIPIPHALETTQPPLAAAMLAGLAGLARLAADVISIEIYPDVATATLSDLGILTS